MNPEGIQTAKATTELNAQAPASQPRNVNCRSLGMRGRQCRAAAGLNGLIHEDQYCNTLGRGKEFDCGRRT